MFWFRVDIEMETSEISSRSSSHRHIKNRFENKRHLREPLIQLGVRTLQDQPIHEKQRDFALFICMRELCLLKKKNEMSPSENCCLPLKLLRPSLSTFINWR